MDFSLLLSSYFLAQGQPSPTSSDTTVLLQQIEFLQDANDRMAASFNSFTTTLNVSFAVFLAFIAVFGSIGVFLFGKTLNEAVSNVKKTTDRELNRIVSTAMDLEIERATDRLRGKIQDAMERELKKAIGDRVDMLERVMQREDAIGNTKVLYLLRRSNAVLQPSVEPEMLRRRGFAVRLESNVNFTRAPEEIVVLDLANADESEDKEALVRNVAKQCLYGVVLVIYYPGRSTAIDKLHKGEIFEEDSLKGKKVEYYHVANNRIALMGAVVDAARVHQSLRAIG